MLKLFYRDPTIEFYCEEHLFGNIPEPEPAVKYVPKWYKNIKPYNNGRDQFNSKGMTAKKCLPMLDAMTAGWIIPLQGDINIRTSADLKNIELGGTPLYKQAEFHSLDQVGGNTWPGGVSAPIKFINNWIIKTAPGWSSLFVTPINHFEKRFTCLGGLVDTDKYWKQINFPAVWHTPNYDALVEAGTPLVQVIPVKRSTLKEESKPRVITAKEKKVVADLHLRQQTRHHVYTHELREKRKEVKED